LVIDAILKTVSATSARSDASHAECALIDHGMLRRRHCDDAWHFRRVDPRLQNGVNLSVADLRARRRGKAGNGGAGDQACCGDGYRSQQCIAPTEPHCHRAPPARIENLSAMNGQHFLQLLYRAVGRGEHRPPCRFGDLFRCGRHAVLGKRDQVAIA
jgi:hypothetical protein